MFAYYRYIYCFYALSFWVVSWTATGIDLSDLPIELLDAILFFMQRANIKKAIDYKYYQLFGKIGKKKKNLINID